ncbi:unnamed protein product [Thelazia callipaeda]|uniref:Transmembrane protein n=1 Tax=Thelazia callipaeda TaxID=103827 RepID=A0A0N5CMD5_THECL|nr:unnamed protein product [Thelazia callipaeda]
MDLSLSTDVLPTLQINEVKLGYLNRSELECSLKYTYQAWPQNLKLAFNWGYTETSSSSLHTAILDDNAQFNVLGLTLCLSLIYFFLWIALIVVGTANIRDCPLDNRLPIWMIVYGSIGLMVGIMYSYTRFPGFWYFIFVTALVGAAIIYPNYNKVQHVNSLDPFYCPQSVYFLSFITVTIDLIFFCMSILCICFIICYTILV